MKGIVGRCVALCAAFLSTTALAVPNAMVDTVQAPAWVERAGERLPLKAGMALENRDRLHTGDGARVVVQFADGSAFKLGENSRVTLNALNQERSGRFTGGLDLSAGNLRLVVHDFAEAPAKRAINVRFGKVTAVVRGETDLTGVADAKNDRVALRDGSAIVSHPQGVATQLDTALQVYVAEKQQAPLPVGQMSRGDGAVMALETQPLYEVGTQQPGGRWMLNFGVFEKQAVLALHDQLAKAGFATRIRPMRSAGHYGYELRLTNLVTEREAQQLAARLVQSLQLPEPKIVRG